MYVYRVGYYSYEESPQRYLVHDVKFDQDEFLQLILVAAEAVVREWLTVTFGEEDHNRELPWSGLNRYESLVPGPISSWLIRERGFRELDVTAKAVFDGWARVVPKSETGFPLSDDPINQAVTARLVELGLEDAIQKKNEEYEEYVRRLCDETG